MNNFSKGLTLMPPGLLVILWLGIPSIDMAQQTSPPRRPPQSPTSVSTQRANAKVSQPVPRFSGKGKARATARPNVTALQIQAMSKRKFPPPLSPLEKQQVLDAKIGTTYATLAPGHMSEAGKAKMQAWSPVMANSEVGPDNPPPYISFPPLADAIAPYSTFAPPLLWLHINSQETGDYYLVDCSVTPGTYTIEGSDNTTQTVTVPENKHLLFHLDQADKGWHNFMIRSDNQWGLFSCEIIRLN